MSPPTCKHLRVKPEYKHIDGGMRPGDRVVMTVVCEDCGEALNTNEGFRQFMNANPTEPHRKRHQEPPTG